MKKQLRLVHLILCILSITTFAVQAQVPSYVPTNGLVGWWPFNGNANDESGNGNNGTPMNGVSLTADRNGNSNTAYSFDGTNDYISLQPGSNIQGNNPRSIAAWFSLSNTNYTTITIYKGGINGTGNDFTIWLTKQNNGKFNFHIRRFTNDVTTDTFALNLTAWYHVAVTYNGTNDLQTKIYLNGVEILGRMVAGTGLTYNTSSTTPLFGDMVDQLSVHHYFNGTLDDIGIWNRALTQQEITALYNAQPCTPQIVYIHDTLYQTPSCLPNYVPTNGLLGWYPFCGNANDESGNGNNGTVNGATLTTDRYGNSGKAYSFNGVNNWIQVPNSASLQLGDTMTFSAWVNVNNWFGSGNYFPILCKSNSTSIQGSYELTLTNNIISGHGINYSGGSQLSTNFQTSQWRLVTLILKGSASAVYLDGQLLSNHIVQLQTNPVTLTDPLIFGKNMPGLIEYANGTLDDIGIWNRVLTQQEITALYTNSPCSQIVNIYDTIPVYDTMTTLVHIYDTIPVYDTIHIAVTDTLIINANLTGVAPPNNYNTVKVYPNPAKDFLILNFGPNWNSMSGYQITITNISGQQVYNGNVINQVINLSLNNWGGTGTYTLTIRDTSGTIKEVKKIVLQ